MDGYWRGWCTAIVLGGLLQRRSWLPTLSTSFLMVVTPSASECMTKAATLILDGDYDASEVEYYNYFDPTQNPYGGDPFC